MRRWVLAASAVVLLGVAACPKGSSSPAREVPVEIDWPDAAPVSAPPAAAPSVSPE